MEAWRRAGQRYRRRRLEKKQAKQKRHSKGGVVRQLSSPVSGKSSTASASRRRERGHPRTIRVVVFTYERPHGLLLLLRDIYAWQGRYAVSVVVYDDASKADYSEPEEMAAALGWRFVRASEHHGKRGFWRWVSRAYGEQRRRDDDYFVFLPDDVRLCRDFFYRLCEQWVRIRDPNKISLSPLYDTGGNRGWTQRTCDVVGDVLLTGCVDMASGPRAYLEALSYSCPPVKPTRWDRNPSLGSGVGQVISMSLRARGLSMYSVRNSLVVHTGTQDSKMNPEARAVNPLRAVRFVDGEAAHARLLEGEDPSVVSMASVAHREPLLRKTIESLYWQVDRINVYLNGYSSVPSFLERPRICVARSQDHGDRGDAGKFFWSDDLDACYHFTCDDDILYPRDYIVRMRHHVERYGRKALISLHGSLLRPHPTAYYRERKVMRCTKSVADDTFVHVPGTGVMAYHTSTIALSRHMFKRPHMADIWAALAAKRAQVPVVVVKHSARWILALQDPHLSRSVYSRYADDDGVQTALVRAAAPWRKPRKVTCVE